MNLLLIAREELSHRGEVLLSDERARHLLDVLGVAPGRFVRVGVLGGAKGRAEVLYADDESVRLRCDLSLEPPPRPRVDLLLALPRPKVLKRLYAPLATLGVGRIYLSNAKRVERFYFDSHAVRPEVYRPRLIEGLSQARDTHLPEVQVHRFLRKLVEDVIEADHPYDKRIIADPTYAKSPIQTLAGLAPDRRVLLALGPEGGWDPYERELLQRYAFTGVGLGPRTLRTDTAVIALLSIVHEALRVG